jgi:alcohol dehydrogenase class IV
MRTVILSHPKRLVFGNDSSAQLIEDIKAHQFKNVFVVTVPQIMASIKHIIEGIEEAGASVTIDDSIISEPTVNSFASSLEKAAEADTDYVIGIGGGSVLDVAKLVAAMLHNKQKVNDVFGIELLSSRSTFLACLPTTSGTGSEVSPNAILLDESDNLKKGVISPHLLPDASYIDPKLTLTVPPHVTAATGMDALTHCIEAYANKFAHPIVDLYALEGIRLISSSIKNAYDDGSNLEAREKLALGSMFGGLCLGPVNTAAVHALSYPLGGEFHIAHGLSNALLLPYVLEFNLPAAPKRYAEIAEALGAEIKGSNIETAEAGIEILKNLAISCGIPLKLSEIKIPRDSIPKIAEMALKVQRLLKNNVRDVSLEDAVGIYEQAY